MTEHLQPRLLSDNQKVILTTLNQKSSLTREEIVSLIKKPRTTVYDNIEKLIELGFVDKYPEKRSLPGRPKMFHKINREEIIKTRNKIKYPPVPKSDENLFIFYATQQEIRKIKQMRGIEA